METINNIKNILIGLTAALIAYLRPIQGDIFSLAWLFGVNFLAGLIADILNGGKWSNKKAWRCFVEMLIFFSLAAVIYTIGWHKGQADNALQCVSYVTYTMVYFYGVNILKNLKEIFPKDGVAYKAVSFMHWVVSVEFVKKIPYLSAYMGATENGDEMQKH